MKRSRVNWFSKSWVNTHSSLNYCILISLGLIIFPHQLGQVNPKKWAQLYLFNVSKRRPRLPRKTSFKRYNDERIQLIMRWSCRLSWYSTNLSWRPTSISPRKSRWVSAWILHSCPSMSILLLCMECFWLLAMSSEDFIFDSEMLPVEESVLSSLAPKKRTLLMLVLSHVDCNNIRNTIWWELQSRQHPAAQEQRYPRRRRKGCHSPWFQSTRSTHHCLREVYRRHPWSSSPWSIPWH